jgi:hypothetical protein
MGVGVGISGEIDAVAGVDVADTVGICEIGSAEAVDSGFWNGFQGNRKQPLKQVGSRIAARRTVRVRLNNFISFLLAFAVMDTRFF